MKPHTRAMAAAAAFAATTGRKVAGMHDHSAATDRRIAAECRGNVVQGFDGDRAARFGGTLPELYDFADQTFVSLDIEGAGAQGYDRGSAGAFTAQVTGTRVQLYDHAQGQWHTFDIQLVD